MTTDLLFEIRHAPSGDLDRLETLEPVLAAAALELDLDVVFVDAGVGHLGGPGAERWDQVTDFGLGRLWAVGGADSPRRVEPVDGVEHLRRQARKIVCL